MAPPTFASPLVAHVMRLSPGDDLSRIVEYCAERRLGATSVLSCVGSLSQVRLRLARAEDFLQLSENLEIVSLVGTICADRSHHLHLSVAKRDGSVVGGHLKGAATVETTAEVVLGEMPALRFEREVDDATGYLELQLHHASSAASHEP